MGRPVRLFGWNRFIRHTWSYGTSYMRYIVVTVAAGWFAVSVTGLLPRGSRNT